MLNELLNLGKLMHEHDRLCDYVKYLLLKLSKDKSLTIPRGELAELKKETEKYSISWNGVDKENYILSLQKIDSEDDEHDEISEEIKLLEKRLAKLKKQRD